MSISFVDRNYIESVFPMRIIENKQLESNLPTEIYELLKNNRNQFKISVLHVDPLICNTKSASISSNKSCPNS